LYVLISFVINILPNGYVYETLRIAGYVSIR